MVDDRTAELPPTEQRYIGVEGVSSDGFELEVSGQIGSHTQVSFGWTDFDIKGDETIADFTPSNIMKLAATHNVAGLPGLTVGTNIRWQNATSRIQGVVGEGFANAGEQIVTEQDSYALVGLMARYALTEDLQVSLNINNVTDEKYINSLYWAQGYYGAPRNYTLSLSWKM
jgi:outer membrane receptor for ferric coprogen and ferric-rhodotorulic acid